jgi:hypothetical protein
MGMEGGLIWNWRGCLVGQLCLIIGKNLEQLKETLEVRIRRPEEPHTMNFLHVSRMSFANVALNIITCL